jgi:hypothetical protein
MLEPVPLGRNQSSRFSSSVMAFTIESSGETVSSRFTAKRRAGFDRPDCAVSRQSRCEARPLLL